MPFNPQAIARTTWDIIRTITNSSRNNPAIALINIDGKLCNKYIKSTQGKLPIYTYLQQTWQCTKKVFIT